MNKMFHQFDSQYMPHQAACLEAIQTEYPKPVISFQLCTGSGKTRVIIRLPSLLQTRKNVFIFPTLSLIAQFRADYLQQFRVFFGDAWQEVSSRPEGISDQQLDLELQKDEYCLVTTYASLPKLLDRAVEVDALIFDEAHHVDGPKCEEAIQRNLHKIKTQFRASATLNQDENPCFTYSFAEAVRDGRCRDYGIYAFIKKAGSEGELIRYLVEHKGQTGNGRVMAFTRYSEADRDGSQSVTKFYEMYREDVERVGGWIRKITGETSQEERDHILKEFDDQPDEVLAILVSCRTISEGVDTRNANVAFFVDTDKNSVSIIQRIGRATRCYREDGQLKQEQRPGSVLVSMYVSGEKYEGKTREEVDEILREEMSAEGDFGPIFRVLAALKQTDEEMYQRCIHYPHFDRLNRNAKKRGYELLQGDVAESVGEMVGKDVVGDDLEEIAEKAGVRIVVEDEYGIEEEEYGEGKEEIRVMRDGDEMLVMAEEKRDAAVIKRKRKPGLMLDIDPSFRMMFGLDEKTDLREDFVAKINIEIENDGKSREERAIEKARELVEWVNVKGKTPSNKTKDLVEKNLGTWLSNMKRSKKRKRNGVLYPSVEKILVDYLGEDWWKEKDLEAQALERAREFIQWIKINGKNPSTGAKDPIEKKLASWFNDMKSSKKGHGSTTLYPSVEKMLVETLEDNWWNIEAQALERAKDLIEWIRENGKTPSTNAKDPIEKKLGSWLSCMKSAKKGYGDRVLYPSVEKMLIDTLGTEWWDLEARAITRARELVNWVLSKGQTPSNSAKDIVEKKLASWFNDMKKSKRGKICSRGLYPSVEKILVDSLGDDWYLSRKIDVKKAMSYKPSSPSTNPSQGTPPVLSQISTLHKDYKTLHSQNLSKRFKENPAEWHEYHRLSEENERAFGDEVPYKRVIHYIQKAYPNKKRRSIVDLGCGTARVAKHFLSRPEMQFTNIDHVSCDEKMVEQGDIANTGLPDAETDMAILCLAMWGSNCEEYLSEAHRILDPHGGKLVILEPSKRWDDGERLRALLIEKGFTIEYEEVRVNETQIQKFCMFVCKV
jgi:superfamily II DNA or RNA helicase